MELEGTSVLVTGGASGIGEASARRLAVLGAKPVICDLNEEKGKAVAADELALVRVHEHDAARNGAVFLGTSERLTQQADGRMQRSDVLNVTHYAGSPGSSHGWRGLGSMGGTRSKGWPRIKPARARAAVMRPCSPGAVVSSSKLARRPLDAVLVRSTRPQNTHTMFSLGPGVSVGSTKLTGMWLF